MKNIILAIIGILFMASVVMIFGKENDTTQETGMITNGPFLAITENTWVWEKTVMNDDTVITPKTPGVFTLNFKADRNMSGTTDCNGFSASYEISADGSLTIGPLASTKMFCEGSQEQEFTKYITTGLRIFFDQNQNLVLLLPYDSGSIIFKKQ
jgi:heat shock protein HslJ